MADIHILDGSAPSADRTVTTRVAFHYSIPVEHRVANAALDMATFESAVLNIGAAELTAIQAGEGVEEVHSITWHPSEPVSELTARIRAAYTARKADAVVEYRAKYRGFLTTLTE